MLSSRLLFILSVGTSLKTSIVCLRNLESHKPPHLILAFFIFVSPKCALCDLCSFPQVKCSKSP